MRRSDTIIVGIALIVFVGLFTVYQKHQSDGARSFPGTAAQTSAAPQDGSYTLADIAKHKDGTSCWSAINGNVYDLTAWIPQHPGGPDKILAICGIDGSAPFNRQHGGASLQQQILAGFKIGTLAQ